MENQPENNEVMSLKNAPNINEVLLAWRGPSHPFKKRNRLYYQTLILMTILLIVFVFFLNDFLLVGVILSIAFVVYAISSVPPVEIEQRILPLGFDSAGKVYKWEELKSFWFEKKWDQELLVIQTNLPFPGQVRAVLPQELKDRVKDMIGKYLLYHKKPVKSFIDKTSDWIVKKIPLDTTK